MLVQGEAQDVPNDAGNEGAPQDNAANPGNPLNLDGDLGAAHQALVQREGPTGFQPYNRPNLFPLRVSFSIQSCTYTCHDALRLIQNVFMLVSHKKCAETRNIKVCFFGTVAYETSSVNRL